MIILDDKVLILFLI